MTREMACYNCRSSNTEELQNVRYFQWEGSKPFIVENVPAIVCRLCGPTGYSGSVLSVIERIRDGKGTPIGTQTVKVFDFNNPQALPANCRVSPDNGQTETD